MDSLKELKVTYDLHGDKMVITRTIMGTVNIIIEQADGGQTGITIDEEDMFQYADKIMQVHRLIQGAK